jgi:UDP-glucose 4-epimerase|tara:strand:+ start:386 stop:1312 length:927 start_codon:yes stop_codon:yes gene_type:complete
MEILITGGLGYLGARLSKFLLNQGWGIRIFDCKSKNKDFIDEKYELKIGDISDKAKLLDACKNIYCVIHLAGLDQEKCKEDPNLAFEVNALGTKNVLEAAQKSNVKKFIYMSTFHVYGKQNGTITENTTPLAVKEYAKSKLAGEKYLNNFNSTMKCIILRLSNVYGASANDKGWNLVVNNLCMQAAKQQKIILKTKGIQKRDFVGIDDVSQAVSIILKMDSNQLRENIFNVGGDNLLSINELAKLVSKAYFEAYGKEIKIEFDKNSKEEKSDDFTFDISRIRKLGYMPRSDMVKEIKETFIAAGDNIA